MELNGTRIIPATVEQTWAALNDPEVLKRCINGCESLERSGEDGLLAVVALKVGPVSARFKGSVKLLNVQAPNSYTLQFDGQGGVAGFGKGSADVSLAPAAEAGPGHTQLSYAARATVGGKMAQVGSRLVDAAAGKITEDFFTAFEAVLREMHAAPQGDAVPRPAAVLEGDPVPANNPANNPANTPAVASPFEQAVAMATTSPATASPAPAATTSPAPSAAPSAATSPAPSAAPATAPATAAALKPAGPAAAHRAGLGSVRAVGLVVALAIVLYFVLR
jgi:uncharacterized protein